MCVRAAGGDVELEADGNCSSRNVIEDLQTFRGIDANESRSGGEG